MKFDMRTIKAMADAGIQFLAGISAPGGGQPVALKSEDILSLVEDQDQFAADYFGVSKTQYREWVETDGAARCGARTAKGDRCLNLVSGPIQLPIDEWLKRDGSSCTVHGGKSAK